MKLRRITSLLLVLLAVCVFASWQYRLACILFVLLRHRKGLRNIFLFQLHSYAYPGLVCLLILGIVVAMPNYTKHGRTQLHYISEQGTASPPPLLPYIMNCIMPEVELMNLGLKLSAFVPSSNRFAIEARRDFWSLRIRNFYKGYNNLSFTGSNPGSYAFAQLLHANNKGGDGIYITQPTIKQAEYPVLFIAHGFLGSWEMYQGLFNDLKGCLIVGIGTSDLSGIFTREDINKIFTKYIPYIEQQGYKIDKSLLHLAGISNGGSACNVAMRSFGHRFKSIIYISTSIDVLNPKSAKILAIAGGEDPSAHNVSSRIKKLKLLGAETAFLNFPNEEHFVLLHKSDSIVSFLKQELDLQ